MNQPIIEIERIEIVLPIRGRTGTVMAQRVESSNGRTSYIEPVDLKLGFDGSALPQEVRDALSAIDAQQQTTINALTSERDTLHTQVSTITSERDNAIAQLAAANERIALLQSRIDELTAEPDVPIISRRQARLALDAMGLYDQVESAVYSSPRAVQIEYEHHTWRRDNPVLIAMAQALGMNAQKIDEFFALAGTL